MAQEQVAVVLGATGMIGNLVTKQLINDSLFSKVVVLVRKPLDFTHPKLDVRIVDFDNLVDLTNKLGTGDIIFSCIGTTQNNVKGNNDLYIKIDHDIPVNMAVLGKAAGFHSFLLVSAVGAKAGSRNFYIDLKGKIENDITTAGFKSTSLFRPSMLLGERNEKRITERILQPVTKAFSLFLFGSFSKYKAIEGADVAKAMILAAKQQKPGTSVYEYNDMMKLAGS